jgi:hypothetical protein
LIYIKPVVDQIWPIFKPHSFLDHSNKSANMKDNQASATTNISNVQLL